jgi:hypothetical protein
MSLDQTAFDENVFRPNVVRWDIILVVLDETSLDET